MLVNRLGEDKLIKVYITNVIPAVIAMVINGIQPIIDGLFLGKFVGANTMASINIINPFMQLIFAFTFIISTGAISQIGRALGGGDNKKAQNVLITSCVFLTAITIVITLIGTTLSRPIAKILGASDILLDDSAMYIFVISFFAPIIGNMYLFGFCDRAINKPNQYLYGAIAGLVCNSLLDYIFLAVLNWGVQGAALATGIAYFVSLALNIIPLLKKSNVINLFCGKIRPKIMITVTANGFSEAVVCASTAITVYLFNTTLLKIAGESGVTAFTIINYISTFATLTMFGISDGINAPVSYNYGADKLKRVKWIYFVSIAITFIIGVAVYLLVLFAGDKLIVLFAKDPNEEKDIIQMAFNGAKLYSISFFLVGFNIVSSGFFTAIGKALESAIIALSRGLIWILVGILTFPNIFGLDAVWLVVPFAEVCTMIITIILFVINIVKYKRKTKKSVDKL